LGSSGLGFLVNFSIEAIVTHSRAFQSAFRSKCFLFGALLTAFFPFPANSQAQEDPVEEHYRAAVTAQVSNDLNSAEAEYRRVISVGTQRLAKARQEGSQKIPPAYLASLKEVLGNAYHNLGVIYAQREKYPEAAHLFGEAAKWSKNIQDLDRNWGTASFRANEFKTAIPPLQRHARVNPEDTSARQMLAMCYFMTDDFSKAAEAFRPLLTDLRDDPSLLYAAGISMAKSGDSRTAENLFQRMLAQNPNSAEVHLFMGQAHAAQNENADALKEFSRALELNAKLPEAHYSAGKVLLLQGNMEEAEKEFRAELELNRGDAPTEFRLGHVLLAQHKVDEAVEVLADVARQRPKDADARYELGKALLEKGEPLPATGELEKAIRLKPEQPHMYYQLSLAYRRQGRVKEAQVALQRYQKLQQEKFPNKTVPDPENPR
jgi:tetratricopeptide (TPR) repeat protein